MFPRLVLFSLLLSSGFAGLTYGQAAAVPNSNTDWFRDARYGVFMHFLPDNDKQFALVDAFDVNALAGQLEAALKKLAELRDHGSVTNHHALMLAQAEVSRLQSLLGQAGGKAAVAVVPRKPEKKNFLW